MGIVIHYSKENRKYLLSCATEGGLSSPKFKLKGDKFV